MNKEKIIYYEDELNDEFSSAQITPRKIDENYKYKRSKIWNIFSYLIQNVLSIPIKVGYAKIKFRIKFVGKEKVKPFKKVGYFVYINHTQPFADTFIPSLAIYPKRNFFIVNPENISMKPFGGLVELLGAIPVPGNTTAAKKFVDCVQERIKEKNAISIYPEAHIWPYYTKIRPFKSVSFRYPIELEKPVFCITNTYQKRGKNGNKVQIVSYIDGPFYADNQLEGIKEKKEELRNKVYQTMCKRSQNSNIEVIKYIKKNEDTSRL